MRFISTLMLAAAALAANAQTYTTTPHGVKATVDSTVIELEFFSPSAVRVLKYPLGSSLQKESYSVTASPADTKLDTSRRGNRVNVKSSNLSASVDLKAGTVSVTDNKGRSLVKESQAGQFIPVDDTGTPSYKVTQAFALDKNEAVYGLGNLENGNLSQRSVTRELLPGNVEDGIPVIQSVKGYGIIWDNYSPTTFADNNNETSFTSRVGDCIDYYVTYGDGSIDSSIKQLRALTGEVPMFPLWTYGFWQSRERYKSQKEITDVVKRHRELGVPLDGIIQDWQYWGNNYLWNAMEFMSADFNRPEAMMKSIHDNNAHVIISIWSSFGPQTKPYRELAEKGLLFGIETWPQSGIAEQWPPRMDYPSGVKVYDAYSPEARDIYWNNLRRLYDFDMDGWWMDSTEPDHFNVTEADFDTKTALGSFRRVRGAYPLMTVGGVYDHQRATSDNKRVFILTRSGWTGQQRYGCNVWTGDVTSTWDMLRRQVPAMLNFTMTGNPNTNTDIGGFFCGAYNTGKGDNSVARNPQFQELYVRWMQMGAFSPMMRSHGTDMRREIYEFGKKGDVVYDAIADAIKLRYSLLPYIYSTAWGVTSRGESMIRPLVMDFAGDKLTWNLGDQFMLGNSLMAAPVMTAQYTPEHISKTDENTGWNHSESASATAQTVDFMAPRTTDVYFPKGSTWYDFFTGQKYAGGKTVTRDVNLKSIPLYVRAGSIVPIGPDVQYATEKPWDNLEIRVYPGADGQFMLYEDEFDNYNYEKGVYSTIDFTWNDKNRTLTIGDRQGSYPGMIETRKFNVVMPDGTRSTVDYSGKQVMVKL